MQYHILTFGIIILIFGCSQSYDSTNRPSKQPNDYSIVEEVDSNNIAATVKPYDYKWNVGDNLVDLIRKKYEPPKSEPGYPNPFSPATFITFRIQKSDSISFYFCNTNESSCYKFQEGYFEKGDYSIGFQKFNIDSGVFVLKRETSDTTFTHKYIFIP